MNVTCFTVIRNNIVPLKCKCTLCITQMCSVSFFNSLDDAHPVTFALFQGKFLDYLNLNALLVILLKSN